MLNPVSSHPLPFDSPRLIVPILLPVVLDKSHWMLYWLVTAMYPQFLITLDEELNEKAVTVRVGQAVNTVGLAGQRMGISGVSQVL